MRSASSKVSLAAALAAALAYAAPAGANGRFPASNAVVFAPNDPKLVVVRVTFGLLVSRDGGESWSWVCERAVGFSGIEDPTYAITPSGAIVGATFEGLAVSRDGGCSWAFAEGKGKNALVDVAMRPDGTLVGIASTYDRTIDGGFLYKNEIVVSRDDARSFEAVGAALDPSLLLESVEVAPSDPKRIYLTAVRGEGKTRTGVFLVSEDDARTWKEHPIALAPGELAVYLGPVDPKRPGRAYLRTSGAPEADTRLLVTDDAGKTLREALKVKGPMNGLAITPDGARVFAGGREAGVFTAAADRLAFDKTSSVEVSCLGATADVLWACSSERSGFFVGASTDRGAQFTPRLHLEQLRGPLACVEGSSVAKECVAEWPKLRRELGLDFAPPRDGGADAAAAAAQATAPPAQGPRDEGGQRALYVAIAAVLAALGAGAWVRRRRAG